MAHLDFGSRDGGGVVGPKLDRAAGRQADKFEVHEGIQPHEIIEAVDAGNAVLSCWGSYNATSPFCKEEDEKMIAESVKYHGL